MSNSDRPTDPDPRSPYECILSELLEIKQLLQGPTGHAARLSQLELLTWLPVLAALLMAACELTK